MDFGIEQGGAAFPVTLPPPYSRRTSELACFCYCLFISRYAKRVDKFKNFSE
jgi:hypothetical protein